MHIVGQLDFSDRLQSKDFAGTNHESGLEFGLAVIADPSTKTTENRDGFSNRSSRKGDTDVIPLRMYIEVN